ncbi:unnamed protein product [Rotaria sordida]|uniref:Uncharacterized protein n=2 Tax=Rotaria sordida TaxID=392033 RepID=A0A819DYC1_9BILA|nr:unnamed protein product [Rotaria sordida]
MILSPAVVILLFAAFITYPTICKSLKCYECSGDQSCGHGKTHHIVDCAGKCMIYQNENNNEVISVIKKEKPHKRIHLRTARKETRSSLHCFDCTAHNPDCAVNEATLVSDCQTCIVYLNANDGNNVVRRCCKSGCGSPGTIDDYDGRKAYFCSSNQCNGIGAEKVLTGEADLDSINAMIATLPTITTTLTTTSTTTVTTTIQTSFECYECSGPNCGREGSSVSANCPSCMVYRNPHDQTTIERRCCWWACGSSNSVSNYNGLETYFCAADKCNGYGAESALSPPVTTTTTTVVTTTSTAPPKTSFECYECSGSNCGREGSSVSNNCPSCMVYRNPNDQTIIERRCCWWACGSSNSVSNYNGLETYFCAADKCNGYGAESALSPPVTTTTTTVVTTTSTAPPKTSFECYECSGPNCGREDLSVSNNCPSCMVYRNPNDQITTTTITTTTMTTTTTAITTTMSSPTKITTTTTTSSSSSCVLNCQNGGTPETEDGCFCYCLENTNGRECENVDCAQSDVNSEICTIENQQLCEESETFAFECLHLCGKC